MQLQFCEVRVKNPFQFLWWHTIFVICYFSTYGLLTGLSDTCVGFDTITNLVSTNKDTILTNYYLIDRLLVKVAIHVRVSVKNDLTFGIQINMSAKQSSGNYLHI